MNNNIVNGIDYGPIAALIGSWESNKGLDFAPKVSGEETTKYFERIIFEAIGDVTNVGAQTLAVLRYHQVVSRLDNNKVFHNETGYWMWDGQNNILMQSLTIPRGVCVLAGGSVGSPQSSSFEVRAALDDSKWGIVQSPFMKNNAKTVEFRHHISITGQVLRYSETTVLEIYGKTFEHTDSNELLICL